MRVTSGMSMIPFTTPFQTSVWHWNSRGTRNPFLSVFLHGDSESKSNPFLSLFFLPPPRRKPPSRAENWRKQRNSSTKIYFQIETINFGEKTLCVTAGRALLHFFYCASFLFFSFFFLFSPFTFYFNCNPTSFPYFSYSGSERDDDQTETPCVGL